MKKIENDTQIVVVVRHSFPASLQGVSTNVMLQLLQRSGRISLCYLTKCSRCTCQTKWHPAEDMHVIEANGHIGLWLVGSSTHNCHCGC